MFVYLFIYFVFCFLFYITSIRSVCFFFNFKLRIFLRFPFVVLLFFLCIVCIVLLLLLLLLLLLQQFTHSKTVFFFFVFIAVVKLKSKRRSVFFLWWFSTIPRRLHTHTNEFWFGLLLLLALLLRFVGVFISLNRAISVTHALHAIARAHFEFASNNGIEGRNDVCAYITILLLLYAAVLVFVLLLHSLSHSHSCVELDSSSMCDVFENGMCFWSKHWNGTRIHEQHCERASRVHALQLLSMTRHWHFCRTHTRTHECAHCEGESKWNKNHAIVFVTVNLVATIRH